MFLAASGQLPIDHTTIDDIRGVTLRGEIDRTVKSELSEGPLPDRDTAARPWAIPATCPFKESSDVTVLVSAHQKVSDAQGWLHSVDGRDPVLRFLPAVGLYQVIPCHPTIEQALTAHPISRPCVAVSCPEFRRVR
ncbi:anti-sigma factor antagonist [Streptomyces sp. TG1A-60]|uniref:anti-sigma factor antagonist n=1 Tax=Streptomyces sp. TG1A-60 TaxID=3129111 RepID=UPI0030D138A3